MVWLRAVQPERAAHQGNALVRAPPNNIEWRALESGGDAGA